MFCRLVPLVLLVGLMGQGGAVDVEKFWGGVASDEFSVLCG